MSIVTAIAPRDLPRPSLIPLLRLLDPIGIVEHSNGRDPDPTQGHCVDDAGRALGLCALHPHDLAATTVASACLLQLERCYDPTGTFVLRLDEFGRATNHPSSDDATARALWGLALAATSELPARIALRSRVLLDLLRGFESPFPRAAAHATVAGALLLERGGDREVGEELLLRNAQHVPRRSPDPTWAWPEPRMTYGNALIPEALMRAGRMIGESRLTDDGLDLLDWLLAVETHPGGWFSFTPTAGRTPDGTPGVFDQQPLEAWTTAAACLAAIEIDGSVRWAEGVQRAAQWFAGENDGEVVMWDGVNGAAYDGLTSYGVNPNQGAESSIALIGTLLTLEALWSPDRARHLHPSSNHWRSDDA